MVEVGIGSYILIIPSSWLYYFECSDFDKGFLKILNSRICFESVYRYLYIYQPYCFHYFECTSFQTETIKCTCKPTDWLTKTNATSNLKYPVYLNVQTQKASKIQDSKKIKGWVVDHKKSLIRLRGYIFPQNS